MIAAFMIKNPLQSIYLCKSCFQCPIQTQEFINKTYTTAGVPLFMEDPRRNEETNLKTDFIDTAPLVIPLEQTIR